MLSYLEQFEHIGPDEYRTALEQRNRLRALFAAVGELSAVCVAPAQPGVAAIGMGIGDPVYGDVSSVLGSPAVLLPVMQIDGLPFGVQVMGQAHEDYALSAAARWIMEWSHA